MARYTPGRMKQAVPTATKTEMTSPATKSGRNALVKPANASANPAGWPRTLRRTK